MRHVTVRDLMHPSPPTVGCAATVDEALDALLHAHVSEIYVVDTARRLMGVVPDYELLKSRLSHSSGLDPVGSIMTRCCATTHPDIDVAALATVFRECRYHRLAVVEDGMLVGQIGRLDILRSLAGDRADAHARSNVSVAQESRGKTLVTAGRLGPHDFGIFRSPRMSQDADVLREQRETA